MSFERQAFKGATWLSIFNFLSQMFSWATTILIARILVPDDYGIMEMSFVITGYASIFSELGLGASIIQRPEITQKDLSSIFWFSFLMSIILALSCFIIAYPTAYLFNDQRVIPITRAVSIIYILTGLQIIPINLLKKELEFKKIGAIEMGTTFVACCAMYLIALLGGGVWTLMGGMIIRQFTRLLLLYSHVKWLPDFHFNYKEVKSYLGFGVFVALSGSLFYFRGTSDKLFAGMVWTPTMLGYYTFALSLAAIPTDKITSIINQVSFSTFSKLQDDIERSNFFYLNAIKILASIILPLFLGGFLVGDELIKTILSEKWFNMIPLFRYLCLAQIMTSLNAPNSLVHLGQGRARWDFMYNLVSAICMPLSFFIALKFNGLTVILIPWLTIHLILCSCWTIVTLRKVGITIKEYFDNIRSQIMAVFVMTLIILTLKLIIHIVTPNMSTTLSLILQVSFGSVAYILSIILLDQALIIKIKALLG